MTYQPPHPPHPHWQHPTAPQPPAKKKAGWQQISLIAFSVVVLCCGGAGIISTFADDPADQNKAAGLTAAGPDAEQTAGPAVTTPPTTAATTEPAAPQATSPEPSPTRTRTTPAARPTTSRPVPKPTTKKPTPKPTTKAPAAVYYKNCDAVRAAGAAPIRVGDPGYARHLDRDGDGQGCGSD